MPGFPLVSLVNRAVKLTRAAGPPGRVTLEQRKPDTRAVIQHPGLSLVDPGEHDGGRPGSPRRVVRQPQHGHVQPAVRHHADDFRHATIAGADHPEPGRRLTGDLIAAAMLGGQHQSAADQIAGADLLPPILQGGGHRDHPVHPDR